MKTIAITSGIDFLENKNKYVLNDEYMKSFERFGVNIIIISPIQDLDCIRKTLSFVDGVVISGGNDINPIYYNENPIYKLDRYYNCRDEFEIKVFNEAINMSIPVLGVCRGMQIGNVALGGTLYQDIYEQGVAKIKHLNSEHYDSCEHFINIEKNSFLFYAHNKKRIVVNSIHHQAIKDLGVGLKVIAKSDDGIIEGVELENGKFFGVQFHPERDLENKFYYDIFKYFVEIL